MIKGSVLENDHLFARMSGSRLKEQVVTFDALQDALIDRGVLQDTLHDVVTVEQRFRRICIQHTKLYKRKNSAGM